MSLTARMGEKGLRLTARMDGGKMMARRVESRFCVSVGIETSFNS